VSMINSISRAAATAQSLRRDVIRKVRQVGVAGTASFTLRKLQSAIQERSQGPDFDAFDAQYGTDTARIVTVGSLDISDDKLEHTNRYEAVVPRVFEGILQDLDISYSNFIFIDIGSGKGRALLLASRYPFRRIIGVELSAALTDIAVANIRQFKDDRQQCSNIEAVCSDAMTYELPHEDTVLYCNNPFDGELMRIFVPRIEQSLREFPRTLHVVYQRALHRQIWDRSSTFRHVRTAERYVAYRNAQ